METSSIFLQVFLQVFRLGDYWAWGSGRLQRWGYSEWASMYLVPAVCWPLCCVFPVHHFTWFSQWHFEEEVVISLTHSGGQRDLERSFTLSNTSGWNPSRCHRGNPWKVLSTMSGCVEKAHCKEMTTVSVSTLLLWEHKSLKRLELLGNCKKIRVWGAGGSCLY
jgi:hypothetical protein